MTSILISDIVLEDNIRHDVGDISSLVANIERVGILQPVLVAPRGDKYVLIDGHRRYAAAVELQEQELPAHVTTFMEDDTTRISMQYSTNVERVDLSAYEKMQTTMELKEAGLKQADVAAELGMTKGEVSKAQKVVKLISDLPNEADADKLSETALFDLEELATESTTEPYLVENALRALVNGEASSVRAAFGSAERESRDARVLELLEPIVAHLHKIGCKFAQEPVSRAEIICTHHLQSNYGSQLGFDHKEVEMHRTLDCHIVHMGKGYSGPVLTEYCMKPASHREKGKSGLKEVEADTKQQRRETERLDRKATKDAKVERQAHASDLLTGKWTQKTAISMIGKTVRLGNDANRVTSNALGLEKQKSKYGDYRDYSEEVATWIGSLPASKQDLAPIMVLAAYMYVEGIGIEDWFSELFEGDA